MEDPRVFSDRNCECVVSGTDSPDTLHSVFADRLRSPLCYPVQQHDERRGNGEDQETEGVTLGNIHESERLSGFPSSGTSVQDTHHEKYGRTQFSVKINTDVSDRLRDRAVRDARSLADTQSPGPEHPDPPEYAFSAPGSHQRRTLARAASRLAAEAATGRLAEGGRRRGSEY